MVGPCIGKMVENCILRKPTVAVCDLCYTVNAVKLRFWGLLLTMNVAYVNETVHHFRQFVINFATFFTTKYRCGLGDFGNIWYDSML